MNGSTHLLASRFRGCLLGLAIGDALGSHFEAQSPESIGRRYDSPAALFASPPLAPWYYTDDTQMAIGVAETLVACGMIDENALCRAFVANYAPSRGYGRGARVLIECMEDGGNHRQLAEEYFPGGSYGNGAAMRVAPVGALFRNELDRTMEEARRSALPTHVHPLGIEGAQLLAVAVALSMRGDSIDRERFFAELISHCTSPEFRDRMQSAAVATSADQLAALGNGIEALESVCTAIACFALSPDSYEAVVGRAILLGGDTDTIAAMAGALSGAALGIEAIPRRLLDSLEDEIKGRSYLLDLADRLAAKATA
jgi:poly(ADP-ribose) glycohydrolase ARH3